MKTLAFDAARRGPLWALALAGVLGCSGRPAYQPPKGYTAAELVPVSGVVTLNGKPLATAVVTFLPEEGVPGVAETDKDGRYVLKSLRNKGVIPGEHRVAISYLLSSGGEAMDLGERSALVHSPVMMTAREKLPREYSHLSYTTLRATVGSRGGTFNFGVKATIPVAEKTAAQDVGGDAKAGEKKEGMEQAAEAATKDADKGVNEESRRP